MIYLRIFMKPETLRVQRDSAGVKALALYEGTTDSISRTTYSHLSTVSLEKQSKV